MQYLGTMVESPVLEDIELLQSAIKVRSLVCGSGDFGLAIIQCVNTIA
jgi:hypothetical protein